MFDFFKKKKAPETTEEVKTPEPVESPVETVVEPVAAEVETTVTEAPIVEETVAIAETVTEAAVATPETEKKSWAAKLKAGLSKTRQNLGGQISSLFGGGKIDEETYEDLESILLTADIGISATEKLLGNLKQRVKREKLEDTTALKGALKAELLAMLAPLEEPLDTQAHMPYIIMLVGVNGAGKTTTIGKLAKRFQSEGETVMIAAGDTFRAAAREQLQVWGERNEVHVVSNDGADPAAVIFDAVNSAKAKDIDIIIADTAGRLPTQMHLMDEITKVKRVIKKAVPEGPHEILLVLDANTGQNAVSQVKAFDDALGVTGLVLSKLDGTAKGGVIAAIADARPIPIRFIGIGEAIDDLRPFNAQDFVDALFDA